MTAFTLLKSAFRSLGCRRATVRVMLPFSDRFMDVILRERARWPRMKTSLGRGNIRAPPRN